jgi:hypothetical protein
MTRFACEGAKLKAQRRYRWAKATERGGTSGRKSELLTVPAKEGNPPRGTLWRERGVGNGTVGGTDEREFEP